MPLGSVTMKESLESGLIATLSGPVVTMTDWPFTSAMAGAVKGDEAPGVAVRTTLPLAGTPTKKRASSHRMLPSSHRASVSNCVSTGCPSLSVILTSGAVRRPSPKGRLTFTPSA